MKSLRIALAILVIFGRAASRANPPEYLAADREPAVTAGEEASPFEEISVQPHGWRLGQSLTDPFFRDAVFSLEPRFYYRYLDDVRGLHEAAAIGGATSLTSGWWRDIVQLGFTGYTTQPLATGHDPGGTSLLRPNGDGLSVLGQAWLKLKTGPLTATLFRQELELPFINSDDTRMTPNTFEAYLVEYKPSDTLRCGIAYVTREKSKTSAEFRPMGEIAGVPDSDRGTAVAGLLLGSKGVTYIGAIDELTWDLLNIAYLEGSRTWQFSDEFQLRAAAQFIHQQSVGEELLGGFATQLYGASLAASYRSAVITLAFTSTADGSGILRPFGGPPSFNSLMFSDFDKIGENSVRLGVSYDFARVGLTGFKAFINYAHGELSARRHEDEINATTDYRFTEGVLKNLWLRIRFAHNSGNSGEAGNDFRIILNYTFSF